MMNSIYVLLNKLTRASALKTQYVVANHYIHGIYSMAQSLKHLIPDCLTQQSSGYLVADNILAAQCH
jgi:hypothetical protein